MKEKHGGRGGHLSAAPYERDGRMVEGGKVLNLAELFLTAVSLAADASSAAMTDGMIDRSMNVRKACGIALLFGFFQFCMPLIGYYASSFLSALPAAFCSWLSFFLLFGLGAKMIFDGSREYAVRKSRSPVAQADACTGKNEGEKRSYSGKSLFKASDATLDGAVCISEKIREKKPSAGKNKAREKAGHFSALKSLMVQAFATSVDALAVGVTFLMADAAGNLPLPVWPACLLLGVVAFALSFAAVWVGRIVGDRFSDRAEIAGGTILVAIGVKILVQSLC